RGGRGRRDGRDEPALPAHRGVSAGIGFVPQTGNVFTSLTGHENLRGGGHVVPGSLRERLDRAYALCPPLAARRALRAPTLSGGGRQLRALARPLLQRPTPR